jgi:hypothetical protein
VAAATASATSAGPRAVLCWRAKPAPALVTIATRSFKQLPILAFQKLWYVRCAHRQQHDMH